MFQGYSMSPPCPNIYTPWCVYASLPYATYHVLYATLVTSMDKFPKWYFPPITIVKSIVVPMMLLL